MKNATAGKCLEMIQENSKVRPVFETAMKKGELGELYFREFLERRGWVVYTPTSRSQAHFCDIFATRGKTEFALFDVKTKARLNYRDATGINNRNYIEYLGFAKKHTIPFYLVFINDKDGSVHFSNILDLERSGSEFFEKNGEIICWPISAMRPLFTLSKAQIEALSAFDQRNYTYTPTQKATQ